MDSFEESNDVKEVFDVLDKYFKLQEQINNPKREGMIKALSEAQNVAFNEILKIEYSQGDIVPMFWINFSNEDLYRKLWQYQQGIWNHCVNKYGENILKQILKEYKEKQRLNND